MNRIELLPPPPSDSPDTLAAWLAACRAAVGLEAARPMALESGFAPLPALGSPAYLRHGGRVFLEGGADATAATDPVLITLPPGFRPPDTRRFSVSSGADGGTLGTIEIQPTGQVNLVHGSGTVSLDGITFRIGG